MKCYKLTDSNGQTYGGTQWSPGVTHEAPGTGKLCTNGWIHVYDDPLVAVLMDPIQGLYTINPAKPARLWLCETAGATLSDGTKRGVQYCTTVEEISVPVITTEQAVRFGILCSLRVCDKPRYVQWAEGWLSGQDRSQTAANVAADAQWWATRMLPTSAAGWADPIWAAARAAARAAAKVYMEVWGTMWAAAKAADAAVIKTHGKIDLAVIAREAVGAS